MSTTKRASTPSGEGIDRVRFVVHGAPVPKGRGKAAVLPNGRATVYTPKKTRTYEARISDLAGVAMAGRPPLTGPLQVVVTAWVPMPTGWSEKRRREALAGLIGPTKKPDFDNYLKVIDGMNKIVYRDDAQIVTGTCHKRYGERPRLVIDVRPMPGMRAAP